MFSVKEVAVIEAKASGTSFANDIVTLENCRSLNGVLLGTFTYCFFFHLKIECFCISKVIERPYQSLIIVIPVTRCLDNSSYIYFV